MGLAILALSGRKRRGMLVGAVAASMGALYVFQNLKAQTFEDAIEAPRDASRREEAYLDACRLAMRDKRLTRAEEVRLHRLADELGLAPSRAHELLVQAEAEAGVA